MQTFTKAERLSSKRDIDKLVETGKSFNCGFFKIIWKEINEGSIPAQIIISVPKRLFKKAVDRNRLKRLTREAYRKNKNILYKNLNSKKVLLMFVYKSKTIVGFAEIEKNIIIAMQQLIENVNS